MISDFFETNNYFIDKKNSFQEHYNVYNDKRERIGRIKQKLTLLQKILRSTISNSLLPFTIEIRSANGGLEALILKKSMLRSEIIVQDASGKKVGSINQKSKFFKPEFKVLNSSNEIIAKIGDVWKKSNFIINDPLENQIGTIDQKRNGAMKNAARATNRCNISILESYTNSEEKITILSSAIAINVLFI